MNNFYLLTAITLLLLNSVFSDTLTHNFVSPTDRLVEIGSYNNGSLILRGFSGDKVQWKFINSEDVVASLNELTASGVEPGPRTQYVCRAYYNDYWIPGKLTYDHVSGSLICGIGAAYVEILFPVRNDGKVQVLVTVPGYVSWLPLPSDGSEPENLIIGGHNVTGDITPICRYDDGQGNLLIGRFLIFGYNQCYYNKDGAEHVTNDADNIEVLAINMLNKDPA